MPVRKTNYGNRPVGKSQSGTREQVNRDGPAKAFLEHPRPIRESVPRGKVRSER